MGSGWWLVAAFLVIVGVTSSYGCWSYEDYSATYNLDHVASSYPGDEVDQAMKQNQQLSQVLTAQSTLVRRSGPPDWASKHYRPVSVVCPSQRYMLRAFQVDGKQCYVIKPEVQQVRYAKCSNSADRNCYYCGANKGGVSKCEEDYEWQLVWAYCKPLVRPRPVPVHPQPYPKPPVVAPHPHPYPKPPVVIPRPKPHPHPHPYPKPTVVVPAPQPYPHPKPVVIVPRRRQYTHPKPQPYHPPKRVYTGSYQPTKIYAKPTYYYTNNGYGGQQQHPQPSSYGRWKRSVHYTPGKVEQISLYLPSQCSCKHFKC